MNLNKWKSSKLKENEKKTKFKEKENKIKENIKTIWQIWVWKQKRSKKRKLKIKDNKWQTWVCISLLKVKDWKPKSKKQKLKRTKIIENENGKEI
jgi:hypothetical protein